MAPTSPGCSAESSATRSWRDGRFAIRLNSPPPGRSRDRSRNALVCVVESPGGGIPLATTQLTSASWDSASRRGQVGALVEFLAEYERQDYPLVVMGDMNAEPDSDGPLAVCGHKTAPVRRLPTRCLALRPEGAAPWTWGSC